MSDDVVIPATPDVAQRRRDNLAKARAARKINRTANVRTAADVKQAAPAPAERAEQTREAEIPEVLTRTPRAGVQAPSGFDLPKQFKKPGWDYQWITTRVYAEPVDASDIQEYRMQGWRPETAKNWPTLVEAGTPPDAPIERKGQRLYSRPMSLTLQARQEDHDEANRLRVERMQAAASGQSAVRGEEGMPRQRGMKVVGDGLHVEDLMG